MTMQVTTGPDIEKQNAAAALSLSLDTALDDYRIVRQIHEDPSCVVYKAEERGSQKAVIVRIGYREVFGPASHLADRTDLAEKLLSIRHTGLASLLKVDATPDGHWIFVTDFVRGVPLFEHAHGLRLSKKNRLKLFIKICKAIHGLHQHCIAHRDLRPSKILVDGKSDTTITDFSIATLTEFDCHFGADAAGSQGLSHLWAYRSPEQEFGKTGNVDIRADIYVLGTILHELLSGNLPPKSEHAIGTGVAEDAAGPSIGESEKTGFAVGGELGAIIQKAMTLDPEDRYASALTMAEDVDNYIRRRPVQAHAGGHLYGFGKLLRRRRIAIGTAMLVVALSFTLGILKYGLAMSEVEGGRNDLTASLAAATLRVQTANEKAKAAEERAEAGLSAARVEQGRLEAEVADVRREMGSVTLARDALAAEILQLEARPDPSGDIVALLMDVVERRDAPVPEEAGAVTAGFLRGAAEAGEAHLSARPELQAAFFEKLVEVHRDRGDLAEAAHLLGKVMEFKRANLGATHKSTVDSTNELAMLFFKEKRFEEAESLCRELRDLSRTAFGEEHERTATAVNNLALTLKAQEKFDEAVPLFREAMEIRTRRLGRDDLKTASTMYELGTGLFEVGKMAESEALFRESLGVLEKELSDSHWLPALAEGRLAGALMALGRFDEAEERLLSSHHRLESILGAKHPHTQEVAAQIAKLYTVWGKDKKAAQWITTPSQSDEQVSVHRGP